MTLLNKLLAQQLEIYFSEDDLQRNLAYMTKLPRDIVQCQLKLKDNMTVAGLAVFFETFNYLLEHPIDYSPFMSLEGKNIKKEDMRQLEFDLPFNVVLSGERVALNLMQKISSIATYTQKYVKLAEKYGVKILDTRKTTPGYRAMEKYGVQVGGGFNHRFGQSDVWMIKDNHKAFFGGLAAAADFFRSMHGFYTPMVVEIHNLEELEEAINLKFKHVMLDNFTPDDIVAATKLKPAGMTYEVSGGIRLSNLEEYCLEGVDAISVGALTYDAPAVDISLKYYR